MTYRKVKEITECEDCEHGLAPVATRTRDAWRFIKERNHKYRPPFARDRDRIIHSPSFQRLVHKTQLIPSASPSKYTTRLLHSIKVAQIAQTIARALRLNEDLTVAIALGHDLGHAPFGHTGEAVIQNLLIEQGGFEHNEESVFVASFFDPMNLTIQTLEGMAKHTRFSFEPYEERNVSRQNPFTNFRIPGRGQQTRDDPFQYWGEKGTDGRIVFGTPATYEGQVVDIADEIAYITHDIVDLLEKQVIRHLDLPPEYLALWGVDPSNMIDELINGVISENASGIMSQEWGELYQLKHTEYLDSIVGLIKDWFNDFIYENEMINRREEIEAKLTTIFNHFLDNPEGASRYCIFYDGIVKRGFKGRQLAGHLLASMTDNEARKCFSKVSKVKSGAN